MSGISAALSVAAGREVRIEDAFRLGKFTEQRKRPVLVKLTTAWDRRLVLSGAHKLSTDEQLRRVFVRADEPLETRRRGIMERLKNRAQRQGQTVSVSDDVVLTIDGVEHFCLQRGFVNRRALAVGDQND